MSLAGLTIVRERPMTQAELDREGWMAMNGPVLALDLSDGTTIYPSCDYEGNGPGAMFGVKAGKTIAIKVNAPPPPRRAAPAPAPTRSRGRAR